MRITQSMLLRTALNDVTQQRLRLSRIQEQASSGLAINRVSDDPVGASAAILLRAGIDATSQFEENVTQARNRVGTIEAALGQTMDLLIQARESATQGANGTESPQTRAILALEIERIHEEMVAQANTRSGDAFVFGGFSTASPPFVASGPFDDALPAPTVSYAGDTNEAQTPIDERVSATTTLHGARIFLGDADGDGSVDPGSEDLFGVLATLRDALRANDQTAVAASLTGLSNAIDQLSLERTKVGMTDTKINDLQSRLAIRKTELQVRLSETQDADVAAVFSDLINQEAALNATLQSTTRLMQSNLLDFLR